jgi:hypothetical protein
MVACLVVAQLLAFSPDAPVRSAHLLTQTVTETKPRLWPPIVATAAGALGILTGAGLIGTGVFLGYWYAFSFAAVSVVLLTGGIVLVAVAVPITIIGAVKLRNTIRERRAYDAPLITVARF